MPESDGKNQGEDSPKQAGSCWFARRCWLATSGASLYPPGGCRVVIIWCYVNFVFFRFRILAFTEAAALCSIVLRYSICMHLDSHRQLPNKYLRPSFVFVSYFFLSLQVSFSSECFGTITVFSLYGEYVVCFPLPNGVFVCCDHGLGC